MKLETLTHTFLCYFLVSGNNYLCKDNDGYTVTLFIIVRGQSHLFTSLHADADSQLVLNHALCFYAFFTKFYHDDSESSPWRPEICTQIQDLTQTCGSVTRVNPTLPAAPDNTSLLTITRLLQVYRALNFRRLKRVIKIKRKYKQNCNFVFTMWHFTVHIIYNRLSRSLVCCFIY